MSGGAKNVGSVHKPTTTWTGVSGMFQRTYRALNEGLQLVGLSKQPARPSSTLAKEFTEAFKNLPNGQPLTESQIGLIKGLGSLSQASLIEARQAIDTLLGGKENTDNLIEYLIQAPTDRQLKHDLSRILNTNIEIDALSGEDILPQPPSGEPAYAVPPNFGDRPSEVFDGNMSIWGTPPQPPSNMSANSEHRLVGHGHQSITIYSATVESLLPRFATNSSQFQFFQSLPIETVVHLQPNQNGSATVYIGSLDTPRHSFLIPADMARKLFGEGSGPGSPAADLHMPHDSFVGVGTGFIPHSRVSVPHDSHDMGLPVSLFKPDAINTIQSTTIDLIGLQFGKSTQLYKLLAKYGGNTQVHVMRVNSDTFRVTIGSLDTPTKEFDITNKQIAKLLQNSENDESHPPRREDSYQRQLYSSPSNSGGPDSSTGYGTMSVRGSQPPKAPPPFNTVNPFIPSSPISSSSKDNLLIARHVHRRTLEATAIVAQATSNVFAGRKSAIFELPEGWNPSNKSPRVALADTVHALIAQTKELIDPSRGSDCSTRISTSIEITPEHRKHFACAESFGKCLQMYCEEGNKGSDVTFLTLLRTILAHLDQVIDTKVTKDLTVNKDTSSDAVFEALKGEPECDLNIRPSRAPKETAIYTILYGGTSRSRSESDLSTLVPSFSYSNLSPLSSRASSPVNSDFLDSSIDPAYDYRYLPEADDEESTKGSNQSTRSNSPSSFGNPEFYDNDAYRDTSSVSEDEADYTSNDFGAGLELEQLFGDTDFTRSDPDYKDRPIGLKRLPRTRLISEDFDEDPSVGPVNRTSPLGPPAPSVMSRDTFTEVVITCLQLESFENPGSFGNPTRLHSVMRAIPRGVHSRTLEQWVDETNENLYSDYPNHLDQDRMREAERLSPEALIDRLRVRDTVSNETAVYPTSRKELTQERFIEFVKMVADIIDNYTKPEVQIPNWSIVSSFSSFLNPAPTALIDPIRDHHYTDLIVELRKAADEENYEKIKRATEAAFSKFTEADQLKINTAANKSGGRKTDSSLGKHFKVAQNLFAESPSISIAEDIKHLLFAPPMETDRRNL